MIKLLAETPHDQEMIDKFQRALNNLRKIVDVVPLRSDSFSTSFKEFNLLIPPFLLFLSVDF